MKIENHASMKTAQLGMTLIELVLVIIIISILGAVGSAQISSSEKLTLSQQARAFSSQLRHAQFLASNWGCDIAVTVTATKYEATYENDYFAEGKVDCIAGNVVKDPASGQDFSITLDDSATFTKTGSFYFDVMGRPKVVVTDALLGVDTTFEMNYGTETWESTIVPVTGFVSLAKL